jgi:hypothetical protein
MNRGYGGDIVVNIRRPDNPEVEAEEFPRVQAQQPLKAVELEHDHLPVGLLLPASNTDSVHLTPYDHNEHASMPSPA